MSNSDSKTLYLIDGHAQFYRAYHAIRGGMNSPVTQEPTHLTFGFVGMLLKLLRDEKPDYLAVVIDVSGDRESFRSELYPEYKANREAPPEDFRPQVQRCLQILEQMHIPVLGVPGVEADDVIATLTKKLTAAHPDLKIRIVSRDKDLLQLANERIDLWDAYKEEVVTPEALFGVEGLKPEHVVDVLALMGDSIDNIPGVPGIGKKTAGKLMLEYGSIENLLEHLDEIKGKRRENLEASRELLPLSKQLVQLKYDVPAELDLETTHMHPETIPAEEVVAIFNQLGFNRHIDEVRALVGNAAAESTTTTTTATARPSSDGYADSLFAGFEPVAVAPTDPGKYETITDEVALDELINSIQQAGRVAVDVETSDLSPIDTKLCGMSFAVEPKRAAYVPIRAPEGEKNLPAKLVSDRLRPVLEDESIAKVGHHLKFDINVLRAHGIELRGISFDTMVASYIIDATRSSHKLDVLALALLKHTCQPLTELIGTGKNQKGFDEVPLEQAGPYAAEDADITLRLSEIMARQLDDMDLRELFDDVEMPLIEVLAELEYNGIRVDPDELDRQREHLAEQIEDLRRSILEIAPHPFNPDSPKQLAVALFNKPDADPPGLGIRPLKRGKTGPSTDQEVLEKIAGDPDIESPIPRMIVEYRQLTKLVNTYLVALKQAINETTGRVHASFNQTVAATGRLSSSDPNLQNIPIRTEVGREVRKAFVAEPGHLLLAADYSQIELRVLAHLSEDPALILAFHEDLDIHTAVAAEVFNVEPEDVTPTQRSTAKMVNFGIVYGITPFGLARRLGGDVTQTDAAKIIDDYKARFSRITTFLQECVQHAEQEGYVATILGRRRRIEQIRSRHPQRRALGERMAINTVVQGSAADLIKLSMVQLHRELPQAFPATKMLLQIHDELVFEAPEAEAKPALDFITQRMEHAMELKVPLKVDAAMGSSWFNAK